MVLRVTSDAGKVYEFEDGISDTDALDYIKTVERPPETMDVVKAIPAGLQSGWTKAAAGAAELYGDIMPDFLGAQTARDDSVRLKAQAEAEGAGIPKNMTLPQQALFSAGVSVPEATLWAVTGGVGGLATAALGTPMRQAAKSGLTAALAGMSATEGLREYGEQRTAGFSPLRSGVHAGIQAAAEYFPEKWVFKPLVEALTLGKSATAKMFGNMLGREIAGEEVTTLIEFINKKMSREPMTTLAEAAKQYAEEAAVTAMSAGISGPIQATAGAVVAGALAPVQAKIEQGQLENEWRQVAPDTSRPLFATPEGDVQERAGVPSTEDEFLVPAGIIKQSLDTELDRIVTDPDYTVTDEQALRVKKLRDSLAEIDARRVVDVTTDTQLFSALDHYLTKRAADILAPTGEDAELSMSDFLLLMTHQKLLSIQREKITGEAGYIGPETDTAPFNLDAGIAKMASGQYGGGLTDVVSHLQSVGTNRILSRLAVASDSPSLSALKGQHLNQVWQQLQPGQVVTTVGVQQNLHGLPKLVPLARQVETWLKMFMPEVKVILTTPAAAQEAGVYGFAAGVDNTTFILAADPFRSPQEVIYTLSHEFGHGLVYRKFLSAPSQVQTAIIRDYMQWLQSLKTATPEEFASTGLRPGSMQQYTGRTTGTPFGEAKSGQLGGHSTKYSLNFDEWLAEQTHRYFYNRNMYSGEVKTWFESVIDTLKAFFGKFSQRYAPTENFEKWLDQMVINQAWEGAKAQGHTKMRLRSDLTALGIPQAHIAAAFAPAETPTTEGITVTTAAAEPITLQSALESLELTTRYIQALPKKPTLTRKEAQALLNKMPLPKAEKALVQEVLNDPQFQRERFDTEWFKRSIAQRLMPLDAKLYTENNADRLNIHHTMINWGMQKLSSYAEADDIQGRKKWWFEGQQVKPFARVWETPFGAYTDPHFNNDKYFAHTRGFDHTLQKQIRYIFEMQSNLFQTELPASEDRIQELKETQGRYQDRIAWLKALETYVTRFQQKKDASMVTLDELLLSMSQVQRDQWRFILQEEFAHSQAGAVRFRELLDNLAFRYQEFETRLGELDERIRILTERKDGGFVKKLVGDFQDLWHRRVIGEEIRLAAYHGMETLRFATAETVAKVEGWSVSRTYKEGASFYLASEDGAVFAGSSIGKPANFVANGHFFYDSNLQSWKAKGSFVDPFNRPTREGQVFVSVETYGTQRLRPDSKIAREIEKHVVERDYGSMQPLFNRHKKNVEEYIKREYGGKLVEDDNGNTWIEMEVPASAATEPVIAFDRPLIPAIGDLYKKVGLSQRPAHDLARFNWFLGKFLGPFQLLKLNEGFPGISEYRQGLRNMMQYKGEWLQPANEIINMWNGGKIDGVMADKIAKVLFDEAEGKTWFSQRFDDPERPGRSIFVMDDAIARRYGLNDEAREVYSRVRDMYYGALDEMEKVGTLEMLRNEGFPPDLVEAVRLSIQRRFPLADIKMIVRARMQSLQNQDAVTKFNARWEAMQEDFERIRSTPYTPYPRFGQYTFEARDEDGKLVYFEAFETKLDRQLRLPELQRQFAAYQRATGYIEDIPYMFQGMPSSLIDSLAKTLELSPEQLEKYKDRIKDLSNAQAFIKRMKRRTGVLGYSEDGLRGFADYFRRFATYIARVKGLSELHDAEKMLAEYITQLRMSNQDAEKTKFEQLHEWMTETSAYLRDPGKELSEVKAMVSLWHFGFNLSSAAMNSLQVPLVTLPYMAERFGFGRSLNLLRKAYADVAKSWKDPASLSPAEQWAITAGLEAQFLDESFATELAQVAEGAGILRVHPSSRARKLRNQFNHYAMWAFQKAEEVNRRVTFLAAFRGFMAQAPEGSEQEQREWAFNQARSTVEDTQNEYTIQNRPVFMRGNKSVVFQFMHYQQNMIFQMLGGDASWWRLLLAQLLAAGALGLPFAEDIGSLVKFLGRKVFGADWDAEKNMREFLVDMHANPDLILRGFTSSTMGYDLSKRISLGEVVPGMRAIGSHQKFNEALSNGAGDLAGPGIGLILNLFRFIAEDDPNKLREWSRIAPSSIRNVMKAIDAEAGVRDRAGSVLYEPGAMEQVGMATGFLPKELSDAYKARTFTMESATYWTQRRENLLNLWFHVNMNIGKPREGVADVLDRVHAFNNDAPDPKLRITGDTLKTSIAKRLEANVLREIGFGANPMTRLMSRDIADLMSAT